MQKEDCLKRLLQAYRLWEDNCFLRKNEAIFAQKHGNDVDYPIEGPLVNYGNLMKHIFSAHDNKFDTEAFLGKYENWEKLNEALGFVFMFPFTFFSWNRGSRRTYYLTKEMELMLARTSLENINWSDIKFPFDNFIMSLETPIIDNEGRKYDSILISRYFLNGKNEEISFHIFCADFDRYKPLAGNAKSQLTKALKRGQLDKCGRILAKMNRGRDYQVGLECFFHPQLSQGSNVLESFEDYPAEAENNPGFQELQSIKKELARLVFGFCLFFRTTAAMQYIKVEKSRLPSPKRKRNEKFALVTDEVDIFTISSAYALDIETKKVIKNVTNGIPIRTLIPHPRNSYWRRPPGKGNDPTYPKEVWVRDTKVNEHLKDPESLFHATRKDL